MIDRITNRRTILTAVLLLVAGTTMTACKSMSRTERGAVIGAGSGAVIGGAIGAKYGDTAKGAIIGAAVGGAAGAIIGNQMDKQAEDLENDLPDAEVDRVAEGILLKFHNRVLFDFDSADLRGEAREALRNLAQNLNENPNTDITIIGHTDGVGSDDYNLGLSQRRARAAADYLIGQGVSSRRVTTVGKGETEPIASNDTDTGRQQNRRVEAAIYANEEYRDELARQN